MNNIHLRSCIGIKDRNDLDILPYFLDHYHNIGVGRFHITINYSCIDTLQHGIDILASYDIIPEYLWEGPYSEKVRMKYLHDMVSSLSNNAWIITADSDEFHVYPGLLDDFIEEVEVAGSKWVQGGIVDRVGSGGLIPERIYKHVPLHEQFPCKCNFHKLKNVSKRFVTLHQYPGNKFQSKILLHKQDITLSRGNHYIGDWDNAKVNYNKGKFYKILEVDHFKWYGNVLNKIRNIISDDIHGEWSNYSPKHKYIEFITNPREVDLDIIGI
jgi:hypothetical protein